MNVGEAGRQSRLPAKTLRYYDEIGIVVPGRSISGYREYSPDDVHRLRFLQRARGLGFSLDDCRELLSLHADPTRASREVKGIVEHHLDELDRKVRELESIRRVLRRLADCCGGDEHPECPILDEFGAENWGVIDAIFDAPARSGSAERTKEVEVDGR